MFDYMKSKKHQETHKRRKIYEHFDEYTKKYNLGFKNKQVLDISGGNGDFLKRLKKEKSCEVYLTEFSKEVVDYANKEMGVPTKFYDCNKDNLNNLFWKKFDFVLLRSFVMFVKDLDSFVKQVKSALKSGGKVVVINSWCPSYGVFMRWQFDDYVVLRLYSSETLIKTFVQNGFKLVNRGDKWVRNSLTHLHWALKPIAFYYGFFASFKNINKERTQKSFDFIFEKQ